MLPVVCHKRFKSLSEAQVEGLLNRQLPVGSQARSKLFRTSLYRATCEELWRKFEGV